jgi:colicin import membrane protein
MARKLKTYQTSQGFFDLAVAAPSMKAALEAWGSNSNLFHQGFAREVDDPAIVAAALAKPGIVLKRPVGSSEPFREHADLPTIESLGKSLDKSPRKSSGVPAPKRDARQKTPKPPPARKTDARATERAARVDEKEQRRREAAQRREEAAAAKARDRRREAMAKAEAALKEAWRAHDVITAAIERDRAVIDTRADAEDARWDKERERLEAALRRASG